MSMLKTTISSQMLAANEVLGARVLAADEVGSVGGSGGDELSDGSKRVEPKTGKSAKSRKLSKSGKSKGEKSKKPPKSGNSPNFGATGSGPSFLTPEARSAFNRLRLAFTEAPILWHFDPECHIWIKTDASGYVISGVLSQLASKTSPDGVVTKADLGQWNPIAFFSRKMIPAEIRYETHDGEFLAIVKAFKIWRHYFEVASMRFLSLRTTITSVVSWIQRVCAPDKSAGPKNSLNTIFKLTIAKVRQMQL